MFHSVLFKYIAIICLVGIGVPHTVGLSVSAQEQPQPPQTPVIPTEDPNAVLAEGYAEYNKKMIANHETLANAFSIKADMKSLYSGFEGLQNDFSKNFEEYGTISAFTDDEETKEILESLDNQAETQDVQNKLDKYKTNSSGWITANKKSKKKETKSKYKTQKAADGAYNDYSQRYDEAIAKMRQNVDKTDVAQAGQNYSSKIDDYQRSINQRAGGHGSESSVQLVAPKISGVALNVTTDFTEKPSENKE